MNLLLDTCMSRQALELLQHAGHDAVSIQPGEDPGDEAVIGRSHREGRVLVTLDKDFGELAIVHGMAHAGIVRLVGLRVGQQGRVCELALNNFRDELSRGAILTVEADRVRVRLPD